ARRGAVAERSRLLSCVAVRCCAGWRRCSAGGGFSRGRGRRRQHEERVAEVERARRGAEILGRHTRLDLALRPLARRAGGCEASQIEIALGAAGLAAAVITRGELERDALGQAAERRLRAPLRVGYVEADLERD